MRVALAVGGISYLKIFGSLIKESHRFGIEPIILYWHPEKDSKIYENITGDALLRTFPELSTEQLHEFDPANIKDVLIRTNCQAVLFLSAYKQYCDQLSEIEEHNISTWRLEHFVNSIYETAKTEYGADVDMAMKHLTGKFVATDFWKNLEFKIKPELSAVADKYYIVGNLVADVYRYIEPENARRILNIKSNEKIITFFAPNIRKHHSYYVWGWRSQKKLETLLKELRNYCDEFGYKLVIKSRRKQWDNPLYKEYADHFFTDVVSAAYPHASALLLSLSELMVHMGSMAVLEAAAVNVPSLGVGVSSIDKLHGYMSKRARQIIKKDLFGEEEGCPFSFKGVSEQISVNRIKKDLPERCDSLINLRVKNMNKMLDYKSKFIGTSRLSADRIWEEIKKHHASS
ncbi:MAG: hypothetical protein Q8P73_01230 [bacterium]|nr:hypothetical protein [bacterium]